MFFYSGMYGMNALGESGTAQTIKAWFGGNNFDDDESRITGLG